MNKIHVARGQNQLGQFSPQEVADGLQSGQFLPTDLGWVEGMSAWTPLSAFPDLPDAGPADEATPPPIQPLGSEVQTVLTPELGEGPEPAWEQRETKGFVAAFIETIRQVLTRPGATFAAMPRQAGYFAPLFFTILASWIGNAAAIIYQLVYSSVNPQQLSEELEGLSMNELRPVMIGLIIVMPLIIAVFTFIGAFFSHFFLWVLGGVKHPYETTFRVVAYAQGATSVLQLIPMCGGFVYPFWYFFSAAMGLSRAQETEVWRAVLALLMPMLICCGLFLGLLFLVGGAAAFSAMEAGH
jgi:hypothetical protein